MLEQKQQNQGFLFTSKNGRQCCYGYKSVKDKKSKEPKDSKTKQNNFSATKKNGENCGWFGQAMSGIPKKEFYLYGECQLS